MSSNPFNPKFFLREAQGEVPSTGFDAVPHLREMFGEDKGPGSRDQGLGTLAPLYGKEGPFRGLANENNSDIFWNDLFLIGHQAEEGKDLQLAATVFSYLSQKSPDENLKQKSAARLAGITGVGGTMAGRLEHHGRFFLDHAFAPNTMAGIGAAGLAFSGGRLFTLARLSRSPLAPALGTWGIKGAGVLGGFAAEVPSFVFAERGAAQLLGHEVDWTRNTLKQELIGSAALLGALKIFSLGGSWLSKRYLNPGLKSVNPRKGPWSDVRGPMSSHSTWQQKLTAKTIQETSGVTGLMAGHQAQAWALGQDAPDGARNFLDSLALHLQFKFTGAALHSTFKGIQELNHQLDGEIQRYSFTPQWHLPNPGLSEAWVGPPGFLSAGGKEFQTLFFNQSHKKPGEIYRGSILPFQDDSNFQILPGSFHWAPHSGAKIPEADLPVSLTNARFGQSERRFGRWYLADFLKQGGATIFELHRFQSRGDSPLPAKLFFRPAEDVFDFARGQEVFFIPTISGGSGEYTRLKSIKDNIRAQAHYYLRNFPKNQWVELKFHRETGQLLGPDARGPEIVPLYLEYRPERQGWFLSDSSLNGVIAALKIFRDPQLHLNYRAVLEGALHLARGDQIRQALINLGVTPNPPEITPENLSRRITQPYDPTPLKRQTNFPKEIDYQEGYAQLRLSSEGQPRMKGPVFIGLVADPESLPRDQLLKVVLHVMDRLTLVPIDAPEGVPPRVVIQVTMPGADHPFRRGALVDLRFQTTVGGGIDLKINPAVEFAKGNLSHQFSEKQNKGGFWLTRFISEEILQGIPGTFALHNVVRIEAVDPPKSFNPRIKIITRGVSPFKYEGVSEYEFVIPYDYGLHLGLVEKNSLSGPWTVRRDQPGKVIIIPDQLPVTAEEIRSDSYRVANKEGESPPPEVDSDTYGLRNRDGDSPPPEVDGDTWIPDTQPVPSHSDEAVERKVPEDLILSIPLEIRTPLGRVELPFMLMSLSLANMGMAKGMFQGRVGVVRQVAFDPEPLYQVKIFFPDPKRRPVPVEWGYYYFKSQTDFPFRAGDTLLMLPHITGGSGKGPSPDGMPGVEVPLQGTDGKFYQMTGRRLVGRHALIFPTAPVKSMEWRPAWAEMIGNAIRGEPNSPKILIVQVDPIAGKERSFRLRVEADQIEKLGIRLLPDHQVEVPDNLVFSVESFEDLGTQDRLALETRLQQKFPETPQSEGEIVELVSRMRDRSKTEGLHPYWLDRMLIRVGRRMDGSLPAEKKSSATQVLGTPEGEESGTFAGLLMDQKTQATLIRADSENAPQSGEVWKVLRKMRNHIILGKLAEDPMALPQGFKRFRPLGGEVQDIKVGEEFKIIINVSGGSGENPLPPAEDVLTTVTGVQIRLYRETDFPIILEVEPGPQSFELGRGSKTFGNKLLADDDTVSRTHLRVTRGFKKDFYIENLRDQNPVTLFPLWGSPISLAYARKNIIRHGESFRLGKTLIQFRIKGEPEPEDRTLEIADAEDALLDPGKTGLHVEGPNLLALRVDPLVELTPIGKHVRLMDVLGVEGVLQLIQDSGVDSHHGQIFRIISDPKNWSYRLRNTSKRGLVYRSPDGDEKRLAQLGQEIPIQDGGQIILGEHTINIHLPKKMDLPEIFSFSQLRTVQGLIESQASPNFSELYDRPLPKSLQLFSEPVSAGESVVLGRDHSGQREAEESFISIHDPVMAPSHVRFEYGGEGKLIMTSLEEGKGPLAAGVEHGTYVNQYGRWNRVAPGKQVELEPGNRIAFGPMVQEYSIRREKYKLGEAKEDPDEEFQWFPDSVDSAIVYQLGADGKVLHLDGETLRGTLPELP